MSFLYATTNMFSMSSIRCIDIPIIVPKYRKVVILICVAFKLVQSDKTDEESE